MSHGKAERTSGLAALAVSTIAESIARRQLRWGLRIAATLPMLLLIAGCSASEFFIANAPNAFSRVERHLDIAYGSDPRQRLDVFSPPRAKGRPIVIFWYGGSWEKGRKADYRFVGTALAERGIVAIIPDYRLYPQVTFPAFDEDGARAVAWVEQHAGEFGGNPKHIVLMGHSAGGHTAAFLALNHAFLAKYGADPHDISGFVGLSGTYVFVPDSDELRAAFPAPYTVNDWQPIKFVDADSPPALLLHGLADKEVLPQEAIELRDALVAAHVPVDLELFPHRGHPDTVASFAEVARWRTPALEDTLKFVERVTAERAPASRAYTASR
jgi:acetyl esterase/lipase